MVQKISTEQRLAELEGTVKFLKSQMKDQLELAYSKAVEEQDEEEAARLARNIRDMLLEDSDKDFTFDRLNFDLTDTKTFMDSLREILNSPEAVRRQELRDMPVQSGFPFKIDFPVDNNEEGHDAKDFETYHR